MESLALLVSIIFLFVLLCGPLSLFVSSYLNLKILGAILGVFSVAVGAYWCCFAPFPVSLLGAISLICGGMALNKI